MSPLSPCSSCNRHVRVEETRCPFCAAALPGRASVERVLPRGRLSRATLIAAGATLAGLSACSSSSSGSGDGGTGGTAGSAATAGTGGGTAGAAGGTAGSAAGAGGGSAGAGGGSAGAGGQGGEVPVAIYSAAFPPLGPGK